MYQIDNSTAATTQPASTAAGSPGFFTDGNPATSTPATIVPAEWLNAVMMELANTITGAGLTLTKNAFNQLLLAVKRLGQATTILADTGTANAYTATNATPLVAGTWVDGVVQQVKIAHANTGASTYAPDGLTAIPIYGLGLQPLQGGELALNGTAVLMRLTIAGVNSGNPICVLMECAGGAQQVAPATQSQHAMQLGQATGRLLNVQVITSSGTYTPTTGTNSVVVEAVGGGGGSGGVPATSSTQSGISGQGAPGAYAKARYTSGFSGVSVTIGAGGTAGTTSTAGGTGGTTSFGALLTCPGGGGSPFGSVSATQNNASGGASPSAPSGSGILYTQILQVNGAIQASTNIVAGLFAIASTMPGSSRGQGANGVFVASSSAAAPGVAGTGGAVVVWEYA